MTTFPQFPYPFPASSATSQLLVSPSSPATSCCESGRPIMTDPATGQTICSCQYDSARLLSSYPRVAAGLPMYGSPYADQPGYVPAFSTDPSAFYSAMGAYDMKDGEGWRLGQAGMPYPYDPAIMATYSSYADRYGAMDSGIRRKNATRETTSTLKAWLYEHRKNPYPTKGEKIMLAIITKMTLTQVSTWFANARRRLKKENKMTWEPRSRTDDDDDDNMGEDSNNKEDDNDSDSDADRHHDDDGAKSDADDIFLKSDDSDGAVTSRLAAPLHDASRRIVGGMEGRSRTKSGGGGGDVGDAEPSEAAQKPKIWSLAHTATSDSPPSARRSLHQQHQQQQQLSHPPAPPSLHPHHLTQSGFFFARPWHDAGAFMQRGGYPLTGVAPITAATRLTAPTPIMPPMMSPLTPHKVRLTPADEHRRRSEPCHLALTERTSQSSPSSSSSSSSPVGDSQRDVNARKVASLQQGSSPLPPIPTSGCLQVDAVRV